MYTATRTETSSLPIIASAMDEFYQLLQALLAPDYATFSTIDEVIVYILSKPDKQVIVVSPVWHWCRDYKRLLLDRLYEFNLQGFIKHISEGYIKFTNGNKIRFNDYNYYGLVGLHFDGVVYL